MATLPHPARPTAPTGRRLRRARFVVARRLGAGPAGFERKFRLLAGVAALAFALGVVAVVAGLDGSSASGTPTAARPLPVPQDDAPRRPEPATLRDASGLPQPLAPARKRARKPARSSPAPVPSTPQVAPQPDSTRQTAAPPASTPTPAPAPAPAPSAPAPQAPAPRAPAPAATPAPTFDDSGEQPGFDLEE